MRMAIGPIDYAILALYFGFVLAIGWLLRGARTPAKSSSLRTVPCRCGSPAWRSSRPISARRK